MANFLGFKFGGKKEVAVIDKPPVEIVLSPQEKFYVEKLENMVEKGFTYDRLFTTGHMMDMLVGTRVDKPYETCASVYKAICAIHDNVPQAEPYLRLKSNHKPVEDSALEDLFDHTAGPKVKMTFVEFLQKWVGFYALYGECFILRVSSLGQLAGSRNLPAELHILDPQYMLEQVDRATDTLTGWAYKRTFYSLDEIIHTKSFNPYNKFRGLSPLKPITDELQIDLASLTFNLSFFKNDASPGIILSTEKALTQEQRLRIREFWEKRHAGSRNAFLPAILESGLKAEKMNATHKDMEFVNQKDLMRKEILGIWRVPESLFNSTQDVNFATMQGQMRVFWIYTLIPMMNKFSEMVNLYLLDEYNDQIEFDFDLVNVPAFAEELYSKKDMIDTLWKIGFTAHEINDRLELGFDVEGENAEAREWRDQAWVPWNMQTAQNAMEHPRISETINDPTGAPAGDPGDGTIEPPNKGKKTISNRTFRRQLIVRGYNERADQIEKKIESKMSRYFMELRIEALKTPAEAIEKGIVHINWHKANETLIKYMRPLIWEAIQHGITLAKRAAGEGKGVNEDAANHGFQSLLSVNTENIIDINDTVRDQIKNTLADDITTGQANSTKRDDLLAIMGEDLKGIFNKAVTRASLIARTESASAMNGASHIYYENMGIAKKSWITAHDSLVRDSHNDCEDQGAIPITSSFQNGLMYPGDQNGDAEVMNCSCLFALSPEWE